MLKVVKPTNFVLTPDEAAKVVIDEPDEPVTASVALPALNFTVLLSDDLSDVPVTVPFMPVKVVGTAGVIDELA